MRKNFDTFITQKQRK